MVDEKQAVVEGEVVSRDPATLEVVGRVPAASPADVREAVARARRAQPAWGGRDVDERLKVLDRWRQLVLRDKREIAELVTRETGKPYGEAMAADLYPAVDAVTFLARVGPDVLEERIPLRNPLLLDRESTILREPRGVVGLITPWNYPFGIPASQALYALFAGNAVVLKPSELTTLTARKLQGLLLEAGLPEDVLDVVPGDGPTTGDALVKSDLDYLIFTGSREVGDLVQRSCGPRGVPYCLELGGSDPAVVLEDANLDLAADGIVWARFTNAGQTCAAAKRLVVVEEVADVLVEDIKRRTEALRVGPGMEPHVDVGPLISKQALERCERQVEESLEMGATLLTGGHRVDGHDGHFYAPTILDDVTPAMPVLREETFNPILAVVRVADEDEAVEAANATDFGLTASVWTRDLDRGRAVARRLRAGTVTLNDHTYTYAANETPWGGVKDSGHSFTHGVWGLRELTVEKHLNVASAEVFPRSLRMRNLWWFPYPEDQAELMAEGLEYLYGDGILRKATRSPRLLRRLVGKRGLGNGREGPPEDDPRPEAE